VTCPSVSVANLIAEAIVTANISEHVDIIPGVKTIQKYTGKVQTSGQKVLCVINTDLSQFSRIKLLVKRLHPESSHEILVSNSLHISKV
jgi:uncharacterized protein involved in tolerance to divalent cations